MGLEVSIIVAAFAPRPKSWPRDGGKRCQMSRVGVPLLRGVCMVPYFLSTCRLDVHSAIYTANGLYYFVVGLLGH